LEYWLSVLGWARELSTNRHKEKAPNPLKGALDPEL